MGPISIILIIFSVVGLAIGARVVLEYVSSERRAVRKGGKDTQKRLATRTKQFYEARNALVKIAADDSAHPALEAKLALENIQNIELKELE